MDEMEPRLLRYREQLHEHMKEALDIALRVRPPPPPDEELTECYPSKDS